MTAAPGSFSEGFSTKVLPAVTATGNIHKGIMAGKLNGQIPAHTCAWYCTLTHRADATDVHTPCALSKMGAQADWLWG